MKTGNGQRRHGVAVKNMASAIIVAAWHGISENQNINQAWRVSSRRA
jgi:hypothetical protein